MINGKYTPVIGLEVHVELYTKSKMFCSCSADYFGKEPNTHVCPVCLGLPGALPVPNKQAIEWCIKIGLALNCQIPLFAKFDRKNYFYPDLPKGYQISQYDQPFCVNGFVILGSKATPESDPGQARMTKKKIRIRRVHMEEDTAKLTHATVEGEKVSLIDFNRSGVPLVEIVTEPDFESAQQVVEYLKKLQQIVRYLEVSSADMEKGDMRLEPNISLRKISKALPSYKVEVKNINSFKFVEKAINYEVARQKEILDRGDTPKQETRGWNETKNQTLSQRDKEEANDYRYFPEPDIPPITWAKSQIASLKSQVPELPEKKMNRFINLFKLNEYDAQIITRDRQTADYFEEAAKAGERVKITAKQIANVIINKKPDINSILPAQMVQNLIAQTKIAKIDDDELTKIINLVLGENPKAIEDYKSGKENAIMFLVGQVIRKIPQKLDANLVREKISEGIKQ